ncbi:histidine--tRNA ligase [Candidatus Saccharibacteria bacterium]|nr:histidine--tRNA ligase [Candidatus Saccharibacteria bacterium]
MSSLSTQSYKGTKDYYPEDKRLQNYLFNTWRKVVEGFGYEEYGTPLLEPIEIFAAKSGQELVSEQTYTFEDRGGRTVAIRPEMTPSLSRMVAGRRQELAMPARLYSIVNFMRYERPQRGREREFWQLNADLFGVDNVQADVEIIYMSHQCVMAFGAKQSMFKIRLNNRQLVNQLMSGFLGLDVIGANLMIKLLDKKDKLSADEFRRQAIEIFGNDASLGLPKLAELISVSSFSSLPSSLSELPSVKDLKKTLELLRKRGVENAELDLTLMRGLDYYTGTVFEFFDNHPENNRALFGGGRYDGLVGLFGVEPLSTVGVALGATTMLQFLETHQLIPELNTHTDAYIVPIDEQSIEGANELAVKLRALDVKIELDITGRKIDKQIKTADKKGIPFVIFVGSDEIVDEVYSVKNLKTAEEQKVNVMRIVSIVKDYRYDGGDDSAFVV